MPRSGGARALLRPLAIGHSDALHAAVWLVGLFTAPVCALSDVRSTDYSAFASPGFDPNEYANAILATDTYPAADASKPTTRAAPHTKGANQDSIAKEDISVAISKLTFGIEDVSKQIRNLVRRAGRRWSCRD